MNCGLRIAAALIWCVLLAHSFHAPKFLSVRNQLRIKKLSMAATDVSLLDLRVGKVMSVEKHPQSAAMYVSQVTVGDDSPRTIVSGLADYMTSELLLNQLVIVLCNLKPREVKGILSNGMVLCSSNPDHTEVAPLIAPVGSKPGDIVAVEGIRSSEPAEPGNKASKAFARAAEGLFVNEAMEATHEGRRLMVASSTGSSGTADRVIKAAIRGKIK